MPYFGQWTTWIQQEMAETETRAIKSYSMPEVPMTRLTNNNAYYYARKEPLPTYTRGPHKIYYEETEAYTNNWIQPVTTIQAEWQWVRANAKEVQALDTPRDKIIYSNRRRSMELRAKFAKRRALELLLNYLTQDQRDEWEKTQTFHVETANGRRRYLIKKGIAGNVKLVHCAESVPGKNGGLLKVGDTFCAHVYHPDGQIPAEDNVLAQKLLLEHDESEFLAMANVS